MQEVTTARTSTATAFDQLRAGVLVDTSSQSRAFASFLGLSSQGGAGDNLQSQATQINTALDTLVRAEPAVSGAVDAAAAVAAPALRSASAIAESALNTAKNAPVTRESFEEAKPLLVKAGLSDSEMADLSARVQAGALTWGQLVQTLGGHMTGAKKAVKLSGGESAELQSLFQRLGFAGDKAAQMAQSVGKGDGLKVLSALQNKLSTLPEDMSLGLDKNELATLMRSLRVPAATANKLTQALGPESTVADLKGALGTMAQALKDQQAKTAAGDSELAKGLARIMEKDASKSVRDTAQTTADASGAQVGFELKTKDKNDTGWFTQHEKSQQKASDDVWRSFLSKVRADDSVSPQSLASAATQTQTPGREALDALAGRGAQAVAAQQARTEAPAQAKPFEKVAAPKALDQVTEAMLKDLGQGRKQLTVQLDPENLGKVHVVLQVKGKEVSAVIKAEDADTAAMLSANMEGLKKTLEDQGLTVQSMEVQTGLSGGQNQQASFSAEQHNQAQERQEMARIFTQLRMLRGDSADVAPDVQSVDVQAILADRGLHLIA